MKELTTMYDKAFDVIFIQFEKSVEKMEICYLVPFCNIEQRIPKTSKTDLLSHLQMQLNLSIKITKLIFSILSLIKF